MSEQIEKTISVSPKTFETLENFQLLLHEKPGGVTIKELHDIFYQGEVSLSGLQQRVLGMKKRGLLTLIGAPREKNSRYVLPANFEALKERMIVSKKTDQSSKDNGRRQCRRPTPPVVQAPPQPAPKPPPLDAHGNLRVHINHVIDALENLKEHVPLALSLLLDMDKDFRRFERIKTVLGDLKKASEVEL
jgi:hypothetical protein